jgi:hypothetical protein
VFPTSTNTESSPAPDCELNPLSNPVLAANLGRWAEVYFTNPPERRAQAVAALLRELELEASRKLEASNSGTPQPEVADAEPVIPHPHLGQTSSPLQSADPEGSTACVSCGHLNSEDQSFCGMCGIPLASPPSETQHEWAQSGGMAEEQNIHGIFGPYYTHDARESQGGSDAAVEESGAVSDVGLRADDGDLPGFTRVPETAPYRYRLYVGMVLAVLLGGLVYMAKRGDVFSSGQQSPDSKIIPAPQPSASPQEGQSTASQSPAEKVVEKQTAAQPEQEVSEQPRATVLPEQAASTSATPSTLDSAKPAPSAERALPEGQGGAENFAEAQKYLRGTAGVRNTGAAVPLLWDAVAQGNAPATLVLSDLYLRGDGIGQNCDQARLLLDMAAKKGVKGAGERLRHLQAFGCR